MKILHICNDYCASKVHLNLFRKFAVNGVEQTVYTYFHDTALIGKNMSEDDCFRVIDLRF